MSRLAYSRGRSCTNFYIKSGTLTGTVVSYWLLKDHGSTIFLQNLAITSDVCSVGQFAVVTGLSLNWRFTDFKLGTSRRDETVSNLLPTFRVVNFEA